MTIKQVEEDEDDDCSMCEGSENLIECRPCGIIMCISCLDTYGDHCPGCGLHKLCK